MNLLRNAVEAASDELGWAQLSIVGNNIAKQAPEFDARNYGYVKLGELVRATKLFDVEEFFEERSGRKSVFIRDKRKK